MADEAKTEEEVDLVSIFAGQSEEVEEEETNSELPDDPEVLKALLLHEREVKSKRNKTIKKSKQAHDRKDDELEALRQQIEELSGKVNAPNMEAQKREQKEVDAQWRDSVAEDPTKAIDYSNYMIQQTQDNIVNYMSSFKSEMESMINEVKGATNPEKLKYEAELNALRSNPDFDGLDDSALLKFAKAVKTANERVPRGGLSGKRAVPDKPEKFEMTDELRMKMGFQPKGA